MLLHVLELDSISGTSSGQLGQQNSKTATSFTIQFIPRA